MIARLLGCSAAPFCKRMAGKNMRPSPRICIFACGLRLAMLRRIPRPALHVLLHTPGHGQPVRLGVACHLGPGGFWLPISPASETRDGPGLRGTGEKGHFSTSRAEEKEYRPKSGPNPLRFRKFGDFETPGESGANQPFPPFFGLHRGAAGCSTGSSAEKTNLNFA